MMKLGQVSRKYMGVRCGGSPQKPRVIVLHSTESASAEGAAAYLHTRPDGSAHVVVGEDGAWRLQGARLTCCGVLGFNQDVYHVEQAGFAAFAKKQWLRRRKTILRAAFEAAKVCVKYDIPIRFIRGNDILHGPGGITTHIEASKVTPSVHWDPGHHYPIHLFMAALRVFHFRIKHGKKSVWDSV